MWTQDARVHLLTLSRTSTRIRHDIAYTCMLHTHTRAHAHTHTEREREREREIPASIYNTVSTNSVIAPILLLAV